MLTLELFLKAAQDEEKGQYIIQAELKKIRQLFNQTRLFPVLADLIELYKNLQLILSNVDTLRQGFLKRIKGIDLEKKKVIFETVPNTETSWESVERTIRWCLPQIEQIINEGVTIGEFVENQLHVDIVGILPSYILEGYVLIPDLTTREYAIVRYQISIYSAQDERYRVMKTEIVHRLPFSLIEQPPTVLKKQIMKFERHLSNPVLYRFYSEIAFPFEETLYPIAKRKFLRYIHQFL